MTMTAFFKIFPYLASDYFYITIISFLYWLGSTKNKRLAMELICLVALSTILCVLLKEYFSIARPAVQRFIVVYDPYGFPSADVAVSMVFWGMMVARNQTLLLKILAPLLVILIAVSRIYLGVHSVLDITGGFALGVILILIWNSAAMQRVVDNWMMQKPIGLYLISAIFVGLCIYIGVNVKIYQVVLPCYGALLAMCMFLFTTVPQEFTEKINPGLAVFAFAITIVLVRFIPTYHDSIEQVYMSVIGKYAAVTIWILLIVPKIHFCFIRKNVV